ncbi:MAG: 3-keto-5-aminohexanoate cleavage protein [Geminicoccaceae bacterium]
MRPDLDRPCRIMVAPNGARRTKKDHPALPMNPVEVAATAAACHEAGADSIHLHARDGKGRHTLARHIYESYITHVRRAAGPSLRIQITTEAVGHYTPEQQMQAVRDIRPDEVSLAMREIIPDEALEKPAAEFLEWLRKSDIEPQYILYSPEEVRRFAELRRRGVVPGDAPSVLFVLGRYLEAGEVVEPRALMDFVAAHDARSADWKNGRWMVCAFGKEETACLAMSACLGGDIRVGFENSLWLGNGSIAPSNEAKVDEIRRLVDSLGRARYHGP